MATLAPPRLGIDRLLHPRSVAIVGASPTPGALGNSVLRNLERLGFAGDIHLVNPKRDTIDGRTCVKSIEELPEGIDVAVLAIPGASVLDAVRALAGRGAGAAIIFSAGFAEGGDEGLEAQREIGRIAAETGMVIEGPNCLGLANFIEGVPLTFVEIPPVPKTDRPKIALISQSGAMAIVLTSTLLSRDLSLSYFISTGNEAASGVEDYLDHMIEDSDTQVIGMIVEQFRKPKQFLELAAKARTAGKPIVLLHPGRSSAARESAATHTGAMAGDWKLMKAKVERAGVVLAKDLEELGDILDIVARCTSVPQGGCGVLTELGAFKALVLDLAEEIALDLPEPSAATTAKMRAVMPDFIGVSNPMDLTAQALSDPDLYRRTAEVMLNDPAYGSLVFSIIQTDATTSDRKFPAIIGAIEALKPTKPVIFTGMDEGAPVPAHYLGRLRELGVPYFPSADRALRAIRRLGEAAERNLDRSGAAPIALSDMIGGVVPEYRAKQLLGPAGIPFPTGRFARTLEDAQAAAEEIGWPVVLKAQSAALSHKSDAGGVILNLGDAAALAEGWQKLFDNVAAYAPGLSLDGVLVEGMGARGLELIVGARNDPEWGPIILAGFGGIQAEILQDVRLLAPDMPVDAIEAELYQLKSAALLRGFRGSPALDVRAVAELIATLGRVLLGTPSIREVDLNPVVVYPKGRGCVALDGLMLVE